MTNPNQNLLKAYSPTWAEVDLKALSHNFHLAKQCAGEKRKVLAVVKADAYGHGMIAASRLLEKEKVDYLGVTDVPEGVILRKSGIQKPILLFENLLPEHVGPVPQYHLTATVCTVSTALALDKAGRKAGKKIKVHVKVDTGMGRLGVWHQEAIPFILTLKQMKFLDIEGVYTHFPSADTDKNFTRKQIVIFSSLIERLKDLGLNIPYAHAANSMATLHYQKNPFTLVRPGLMLYGMSPDMKEHKDDVLKPVLSVKSKIIFVKTIQKGQGVSYGRTFIAPRRMKLATIPIGYSEGYFRLFSNNADVLIQGQRCPLLGRVTMDYIVVDVSRLKSVQDGDEVVLLGRQGIKKISAEELGRRAQTINYEITCSLGSRLPRIYL